MVEPFEVTKRSPLEAKLDIDPLGANGLLFVTLLKM